MSNPYTFHIENLMVVVYASTRDEATRMFSESMRKHDSKVIDNYKEWLTEKGIHGSKEMKRIADMYKEQLKEQQ